MMINKKKGQGLSLQVIIIAAICLIVLVVLVFILTGRMAGFGESLDDCISKTGNDCQPCPCPEETHTTIPGTECEKQNKCCCLKVLGE